MKSNFILDIRNFLIRNVCLSGWINVWESRLKAELNSALTAANGLKLLEIFL